MPGIAPGPKFLMSVGKTDLNTRFAGATRSYPAEESWERRQARRPRVATAPRGLHPAEDRSAAIEARARRRLARDTPVARRRVPAALAEARQCRQQKSSDASS